MRIRWFEMDDLPAVVDLRNRVYPNRPMALEGILWKRRSRDVLGYRETFVAELEECIVAYTELTSRRNHSTRPGLYRLETVMDPAYRGTGICEGFWMVVEERLNQLRWTRLEAGIDGDDDFIGEWLTSHGFRLLGRDLTWRLELDGYRSPLDRSAVLDRVFSRGYTLDGFAILEDPVKLRRLWNLHETVAADYPGPDSRRRRPFEEWLSERSGNPAVREDAALVARRGEEFVGMTELGFWAGSTGPAYVVTTGVLREHRGRGLATALKYLSTERAAEKGVPALLTGNHSGNEHIISINRRMGFQPQPDRLHWTLNNQQA